MLGECSILGLRSDGKAVPFLRIHTMTFPLRPWRASFFTHSRYMPGSIGDESD